MIRYRTLLFLFHFIIYLYFLSNGGTSDLCFCTYLSYNFFVSLIDTYETQRNAFLFFSFALSLLKPRMLYLCLISIFFHFISLCIFFSHRKKIIYIYFLTSHHVSFSYSYSQRGACLHFFFLRFSLNSFLFSQTS